MVLTQTQVNEKVKEGFSPFKHLIIDCKELGLMKYTDLFGWSIELLNLKRYCLLATKYSFGNKERFNYSVIDEAITSILQEQPLDEIRLSEYFTLRKSLNTFFVEFEQLARIGTYLDYEIDFYLIGAGFNLEHDDIPKDLNSKYDDLFMDYLYQDIDVKVFIKKAKTLIDKLKMEKDIAV